MQLPPPHTHDTSSPRGSCGVCYAWAMKALPVVMGSKLLGVALPRVFDRSTRTWKQDPRISDPPYGSSAYEAIPSFLEGSGEVGQVPSTGSER